MPNTDLRCNEDRHVVVADGSSAAVELHRNASGGASVYARRCGNIKQQK